MKILIVTYDLKGPATFYEPFYEALKAQGTWWHYLRSTWLVATDKTPKEVDENIRPHMKIPGDRLLVVEMGEARSGWLPKDAWDWIKKHQSQQGLFPL